MVFDWTVVLFVLFSEAIMIVAIEGTLSKQIFTKRGSINCQTMWRAALGNSLYLFLAALLFSFCLAINAWTACQVILWLTVLYIYLKFCFDRDRWLAATKRVLTFHKLSKKPKGYTE